MADPHTPRGFVERNRFGRVGRIPTPTPTWDKSECPFWLANEEDKLITFVTLNEIQIIETNG